MSGGGGMGGGGGGGGGGGELHQVYVGDLHSEVTNAMLLQTFK